MKTTTQFLSHFFGTMILVSTFLLLSPAHAGNTGISKHDTNFEILASTKTSTIARITDPPVSRPANTMLTDSKYWVNYLRSTVNPNEEETTKPVSILDEIQSNPNYWIDQLKVILAQE